jgi:hypothetical protein
MRRKTLIGIFTSIGLAAALGCSPPPPPPNTTFAVESDEAFMGFPSTYVSGIGVQGNWAADLPGAMGDTTFFSGYTNSQGLYYVVNGKAPATWNFFETTGYCAGQSIGYISVSPGQVVGLLCVIQ